MTQVGQEYANIIIDISHESVDRTFQYRIPEELQGKIQVGQQVRIPFGQGNRPVSYTHLIRIEVAADCPARLLTALLQALKNYA